MTDTLIKVDNVSKKFCRSLKRSLWYGMQDIGNELAGRQHGGDGELRPDEFWAVREVGFELRRGECLGLIGHNGAGKTTLLRMLNGLLKPDQGRIEMRGRVGALIALGAGFNPLLTGRENVYINASVLGLKRQEVDRKLDAIIDFAEIGEFIDAPVQTYSSGMNVRLGFAVAAILLEPDVLFLDEVLAVGDIGFTIKCLNLVREITRNAAVVFVSHNMQFVSSFCNRVMVLDHGGMLLDTRDTAAGIDRYFGMIQRGLHVSGTGAAEVLGFDLEVDGNTLQGDEPVIAQGVPVTAVLELELNAVPEGAHILLQINEQAMGALVAMPVHGRDGRAQVIAPGRHRFMIPLGTMDLNAGNYFFVVAVFGESSSTVLARAQGLRPFRVVAPANHWGKIVRPVVMNG